MKVHERELQADDIDAAKQRFEALRAKEFPTFWTQDLTESDTRSKIIDTVLRDVLRWPEALIKREPHVEATGGYIDYLLSTRPDTLISPGHG